MFNKDDGLHQWSRNYPFTSSEFVFLESIRVYIWPSRCLYGSLRYPRKRMFCSSCPLFALKSVKSFIYVICIHFHTLVLNLISITHDVRLAIRRIKATGEAGTVSNLPIGSIGWSLGPQHLGGLVQMYNIFNIVISALLVEETGVPGDNRRRAASHGHIIILVLQ